MNRQVIITTYLHDDLTLARGSRLQEKVRLVLNLSDNDLLLLVEQNSENDCVLAGDFSVCNQFGQVNNGSGRTLKKLEVPNQFPDDAVCVPVG